MQNDSQREAISLAIADTVATVAALRFWIREINSTVGQTRQIINASIEALASANNVVPHDRLIREALLARSRLAVPRQVATRKYARRSPLAT